MKKFISLFAVLALSFAFGCMEKEKALTNTNDPNNGNNPDPNKNDGPPQTKNYAYDLRFDVVKFQDGSVVLKSVINKYLKKDDGSIEIDEDFDGEGFDGMQMSIKENDKEAEAVDFSVDDTTGDFSVSKTYKVKKDQGLASLKIEQVSFGITSLAERLIVKLDKDIFQKGKDKKLIAKHSVKKGDPGKISLFELAALKADKTLEWTLTETDENFKPVENGLKAEGGLTVTDAGIAEIDLSQIKDKIAAIQGDKGILSIGYQLEAKQRALKVGDLEVNLVASIFDNVQVEFK